MVSRARPSIPSGRSASTSHSVRPGNSGTMTHPMAITAAQAVRLLAELLEIDRTHRNRRQPLQLVQKQRRAAIARDLHLFALAKQRGTAPTGAEQRQHPRANVRLKVQLLGGPHKVDLHSDSLAVGGASLMVKFTPRVGD